MSKALMILLPALALCGAAAWCQEAGPERVSVPFSDPSRPGTVKVSLINGGVTVHGYDGKEVVVETHARGGASRRARPEPRANGLHRLDAGGSGLSVEEQDNVVNIRTGWRGGEAGLEIQVPFSTALNLKCVNGGDIKVENVRGEIDADNVNGGVTLHNISGAVVAHALNKDVTVTFDQVTPGKSMSFSSLNGDIDVTLPADTKARVKMKTENGEIYTDFDIALGANSRQPLVENRSGSKGRYRVQFDKALSGTINGGGPEMQFTTFNGKIFIRKKK